MVDYQEKELQDYEQYVKKILLDNSKKITFPEHSRFSKINSPLVKADLWTFSTDNEKIWSQIPFAGTLMIPLHNIDREYFLSRHSFDISEIPNLIKLSKDYGKIQFGLATFPELYEGLDFLDPIFELKPPFLGAVPLKPFVNEKTLQTWNAEFITLAKISYYDWIGQMNCISNFNKNYIIQLISKRAEVYSRLKFLKMDEIVEELTNLIVDDPEQANYKMIQLTHITEGAMDPLIESRNFSLTRMKELDLIDTKKPITYPVEIGSTLMKKITLIPSSYESCISIIDKYTQNDLYQLLSYLDKGVKDRNQYSIINSIKDIETTVDNIWNDANRLTTAIKTIKTGISITLGLVGEIGTSMLGMGSIGLLTSLGFPVMEHLLKFDQLSSKIANAINKDYIVTVYDFKQKHNLQPS